MDLSGGGYLRPAIRLVRYAPWPAEGGEGGGLCRHGRVYYTLGQLFFRFSLRITGKDYRQFFCQGWFAKYFNFNVKLSSKSMIRIWIFVNFKSRDMANFMPKLLYKLCIYPAHGSAWICCNRSWYIDYGFSIAWPLSFWTAFLILFCKSWFKIKQEYRCVNGSGTTSDKMIE